MEKARELLNQSFDQLYPEDVYPGKEAIHLYHILASQLERELATLKHDVLYRALLNKKMDLSDIPQTLRIQDFKEGRSLYFTAAHRYAREQRDVSYAIALSSLLAADIEEAVRLGKLTKEIYYHLKCEWLHCLIYDKMEFEGDEDFDRFFQAQREANQPLFEAFGY